MTPDGNVSQPSYAARMALTRLDTGYGRELSDSGRIIQPGSQVSGIAELSVAARNTQPGNGSVKQQAQHRRLLKLGQDFGLQSHLYAATELAVAHVVQHLRQDGFIDRCFGHTTLSLPSTQSAR